MTAHPNLQQAVSAIKGKCFDEAESILTGILATQPGNVQARWLLVQTLEARQRKDAALAELKSLLLHSKKDLPAIDRIAAYMLQKRHPLKYVLRTYQRYLAAQPAAPNAAFNYAYYLARDTQYEPAIAMYQRALSLGVSDAEEAQLNIANICMDHLHDHDRAREHLQEALEIKPAYAKALYNLGNLAEQEGDRAEASRCFRRCLEIEPGFESALARLADTHNFETEDDPLLIELQTAAKNTHSSDLVFALGKACEQLQDFDQAWQYFSRGNEWDKLAYPVYHRQPTETMFHRTTVQCDSEWLTRLAGQSDQPIFICGMFRTGSTLLEQILAAHPAFTAGGESEFFPRLIAREFPRYPEGLDDLTNDKLRAWGIEHQEQTSQIFGGSLRVTDKRPDNFLYIGLIKAILPGAKFVVTERDWRDVATSIYSVRLGPRQNYATDLKDIRHYIGLQTQLIDHWASLLGDDLLRVRYEDIVQQPRDTVSNLLRWLGEEWDENCLSFHALKNAVKTASVWQVRSPLHVKSVGRWRNYEPQFQAAFGDEPG